MRSVNKKWFEAIVRYDKVMESGETKKVSETYVVDAITFGEAEERIAEEMKPYMSGDFDIKNINPAPYSEIFFSDNSEDDKWYKAKLDFITIDEKTEKEKHSQTTYLCQACSAEQAQKNVDEVMGHTMVDYQVKAIVETKILDVFEHSDGD